MSSLAIAFSVLAILLAAVLIPFNMKRRRITRAAAAATAGQLEHIYRIVERTGSVAATAYILARSNETIDDARCLVPIPAGLPAFPWAGKTIEVARTDDVAFRFVDGPPAQPSLSGKVCRLLQVPRHLAAGSGKERNAFAPEKYLAASTELREALRQLCPKNPKELLAYLLCAGGAESGSFEPIDQVRIGASPAWAQEPAHQDCGVCGKRMALILQLPGATIGKDFHSGVFYLFGCIRHPDQLKRVVQHT